MRSSVLWRFLRPRYQQLCFSHSGWHDFLNASASAKLLNCATNIAAIALFAAKGHVWWHFAVTLAVANIVGSLLGTHMALKHGTGFVRGIFIVVVSTLILKTGYDAFLR